MGLIGSHGIKDRTENDLMDDDKKYRDRVRNQNK